MTPGQKKEAILELDPDALFADGLDAAIVGTVERCGQPLLVVYDVDWVLSVLAKGLSRDEALEHFDFNIGGAWVGERTPAWFTRLK